MWHKILMWWARLSLRAKTRRRPPLPLSQLDLGQVERVLLLNATALGDLLFSTPAIRALKEKFPAWHLELLVQPHLGDLMAHNPYVEKLWYYPGRGWRLFQLMRRLRRRRFDLAIILHGNDPEATLLAYSTGSRFIIGSARSPLAFAYSARVEHQDPYEHAIERRLHYVRLLGADTPDRRMQVSLPKEELRRAEAIISQHFAGYPPLLVALHATGSEPYKWWPLDAFISVGNYLQRIYEAAIIIISGGQDRPVAEELAGALVGPTLVTGGDYPLITVAGMLSKCRLLVANDSGPLHLALALGVPTIALLGADHPRRIGPYRVDWGTYLWKREEVCPSEPCLLKKCLDNRCLKALKVDEVVEVLKTWWEPRFLQA
ncbi:MAG: glycosyltransferase family 9 protein [Thermodesulfobacteriota bacterium]